jgi:hypothetical protein
MNKREHNTLTLTAVTALACQIPMAAHNSFKQRAV